MVILITSATVTACLIVCVAKSLNEKFRKKIKKGIDKIRKMWYNTIAKRIGAVWLRK